MSILDSIKGEKKLSFNNWRYRILHWAFSVKNPDPNDLYATGLPMFLYTHYCPLFHLTNLIVLFSPVILAINLLVLFVKGLGSVLDLIPFREFVAFVAKFFPEPKSTKKETVIDVEDEKRRCIKLICRHTGHFDLFWDICRTDFPHLSKELVEALFNEYMPKAEEARKQAELRKKKWRDTIIFWTNFSRVFIKWGLNVFYSILAGLVLYGCYLISGAVWGFLCWAGNFICWLFTDAVSLEVVILIGKAALYIGILHLVLYVLFRTGVAQRFFGVVYKGLEWALPPFVILLVPFQWAWTAFKNTKEFVEMFYEENCPPIKLVTEREAIVESVAQDGEEV